MACSEICEKQTDCFMFHWNQGGDVASCELGEKATAKFHPVAVGKETFFYQGGNSYLVSPKKGISLHKYFPSLLSRRS